MYNNIPDELKQYKAWLVWKLVERANQKPTKIPIQALNGFPADVTNPEHLCTFDEAVANAHKVSGIGFAFLPEHPYSGIDLDDSHGDVEAYNRQVDIVAKFNSYSELSPSKTGVHIIVKGKIAAGRRRHFVEVYSQGRFFTMTGDVINNAPIQERQELLDILYNQMGGPAKVYTYREDKEQKETDEEIIERASNAANGDLFQALLSGDWQSKYKSQSEADLAFVDIVAFYTQNGEQVRRIYRHSALGQTPKDNYEHRGDRKAYVDYMLDKCFDRQLPEIDIEGLKIAFENQKKVGLGEPGGTPSPTACNEQRSTDAKGETTGALTGGSISHSEAASAIDFPPGLIGEIARYILASSPRPVPIIAITGAIGLMAGLTGRAYNISGTGLNQYILLIAKTGRGKEAIASGTSKIMKAIAATVPNANEFNGPVEIQSSPALLKWLAEKPAAYSIVGEFGLKLKEMSSPTANSHTTALMRTFLDLYNKSGRGNIVGSMAYSDKSNNTNVVYSPAFTLLGETTPSRLYENLNEGMIADGLLPRFMVIDYDGPRTEYNETHKDLQPPLGLIQKLADLTAYCLSLSHNGQVLEVPLDNDANNIMRAFNEFADAQINDTSQSEVSHELWNRAHIKAMKLAALYAVGVNYLHPVVTGELAQRATEEIAAQSWALKKRFDNGEVGAGSINHVANELKQTEYMCRVITEWATLDHSFCAKYRVTAEMHNDKVFPYNSLLMRCASAPVFRTTYKGASEHIKRVYDQLLDNGDIAELNKNQTQIKYGKRAKMFCIVNAERFVEK